MVENRRPSRPRRKKEGDSRQRDKGKRKPEDSLSWSSKGNRSKKYPGVRMAITSITFNSNSSSNHNRLPDSNSFSSHNRQPLSSHSNRGVPITLILGEDSHNSKDNSSNNSPHSSNSISNSSLSNKRNNSSLQGSQHRLICGILPRLKPRFK